jgi:hypothetical protein
MLNLTRRQAAWLFFSLIVLLVILFVLIFWLWFALPTPV